LLRRTSASSGNIGFPYVIHGRVILKFHKTVFERRE
jgi:hypothetical protein